MTAAASPGRARLHVRRCQAPHLDLDALTARVARRERPVILGGHRSRLTHHHVSYWAAEPREVFTSAPGLEPWGELERALSRYRLETRPPGLPAGLWTGGWAGHFAYELGRTIERLPETMHDDLDLPWIELGLYDRVLALDHRSDEFWLLALEFDADGSGPGKLDSLEDWLTPGGQTPVSNAAGDLDVETGPVTSNIDRDTYLRAVERILRYIRDGEVYQVNLSQRFARPFHGDPVALYLWQNRHNPSPYGAYLGTPTHQFVCTSPELFLAWQDRSIRTEPIKGTRARRAPAGVDPVADLLASAKEQAELNMIVDLERNDVARLCVPGTRRVLEPRHLETYATVHHTVAAVGGTLRPGLGLGDILHAMFPGGSISGAPKIRALEIIEELEPTTRGVYTGSIGWIGLDRSACLNIAIRTIIITRQMAYAQAGGGIVADSQPEAEYEESLIKAQALLAGIAACEAVTQP